MKIKKFLAMISLSAFVLANVIPGGVLAVGGENQLTRANLPHVRLDKDEISDCISKFLNGHGDYFRNLSRSGDPVIPEILMRGKIHSCTKEEVIDSLTLLHEVVKPNADWFKKEEMVELCGSLFSLSGGFNNDLTQAKIQAYGTYSNEIQQLCSMLGKSIVWSLIGSKTKFTSKILKEIDDALYRKWPTSEMGLYEDLKQYFDSAYIFARIFESAARVGKALNMI